MSDQAKKDSTRVAAGLKAAIHNPNVSAEAKEQAMERLREMGQDVDDLSTSGGRSEAPSARASEPERSQNTRVLAGYKATLSNPYTSQEAKQHAEEVLQAAGILERDPGHSDEEHMTRVLAGYKSSLSNPRVSEEAKQHAREYLREYGIQP